MTDNQKQLLDSLKNLKKQLAEFNPNATTSMCTFSSFEDAVHFIVFDIILQKFVKPLDQLTKDAKRIFPSSTEIQNKLIPFDLSKCYLPRDIYSVNHFNSIVGGIIKKIGNSIDNIILTLSIEMGLVEKKGGCFIATAACGSCNAEEVIKLRNFRDSFLIKFSLGRIIIYHYSYISPPIASIISNKPRLCNFTYRAIVKPLSKLINHMGTP